MSGRPLTSIFMGGGTPTHLTALQLERLLGLVREWLPLRPGGGGQCAARSDTPSGVRSSATTAPSGTGLAGIETSFTVELPGRDRVRGSGSERAGTAVRELRSGHVYSMSCRAGIPATRFGLRFPARRGINVVTAATCRPKEKAHL